MRFGLEQMLSPSKASWGNSAVLFLLFASFIASADAATNTVTTLADSGVGSLRETILNAAAGDTLIFAPKGTITLTSGELVIAKNLRIVGPGPTDLAISGNFTSRVFNISAGVTSSISGLIIRDGRTTNGASGGFPSGDAARGGGIHNSGDLTVIDCLFVANATGSGGNGGDGTNATVVGSGGNGGTAGRGGDGGAVLNQGKLILSGCHFFDNATGDGGTGGTGGDGAYGFNDAGRPGGLGGSGGAGGAVFNLGILSMNECILSSNRCGKGGRGGLGGFGGIFRFPYGIGSPGIGGNGGPGGGGGGVWNETGTLIATKCTFTNNVSGSGGTAGGSRGSTFSWGQRWWGAPGTGGHGGAIGNKDMCSAICCIIRENSCGVGGQATNNLAGNADNVGGAGGNGAGVFNASILTVSATTIAGNIAGLGGLPSPGGYQGPGGSGGGCFNASSLTLSNCTISGNQSGSGGIMGNGGGIATTGILSALACTIVSNYAHKGGGSFAGSLCTASMLRNCLIALNDSADGGGDLYGCFTSQGHNLVSIGGLTNATGDLIGTPSAPIDPLLGPLSANGGHTHTHLLRPGSPALDAGDDSLTGVDQRGRLRHSGAHVDIGAYEFNVPGPISLVPVHALTNGTFRFFFTNISDATFTVLATTNIALPPQQWINLGSPSSAAEGVFEFSDHAATLPQQRFFQLRSP
jgi:hypothetical protein